MLIIGILLSLVPISLMGQQKSQAWILDRMQSHSPSSLNLLKAYDKLPNQLVIERGGSEISTSKSTDALHYLEASDYESALISMSTNVHEIGHAYGGLLHFAELMTCNCTKTIEFEDIQQGLKTSNKDFTMIPERNTGLILKKDIFSLPTNFQRPSLMSYKPSVTTLTLKEIAQHKEMESLVCWMS